MFRDLFLKLLTVLGQIKTVLETIATNTTPTVTPPEEETTSGGET